MGKFKFENCDLLELNQEEMNEINGGWWWINLAAEFCMGGISIGGPQRLEA